MKLITSIGATLLAMGTIAVAGKYNQAIWCPIKQLARFWPDF